MQETEGSIERYMSRLDKADQKEPEVCEIQTKDLTEKIELLKAEVERTRRSPCQDRRLQTIKRQVCLIGKISSMSLKISTTRRFSMPLNG